MSNTKSNILFWVLRIIPAIIMLQTLYFKFSGAEESVFIFSTIGMEPWARYLVGTTELVASILLLTRWNAFGALIAVGAMAGAIFFHLTQLGIEVQNDGGYLFGLALVTFVCSLLVLLKGKDDLLKMIAQLKK